VVRPAWFQLGPGGPPKNPARSLCVMGPLCPTPQLEAKTQKQTVPPTAHTRNNIPHADRGLDSLLFKWASHGVTHCVPRTTTTTTTATLPRRKATKQQCLSRRKCCSTRRGDLGPILAGPFHQLSPVDYSGANPTSLTARPRRRTSLMGAQQTVWRGLDT
jgi:hypothetical protein